MARSKNSPALFEVIRNAQQKQREQLERQQHQRIIAETHAVSPAAALLRSPLYWFKGKQAHEEAIGLDAAAESAAPSITPASAAVSMTPAVTPVMREVPPVAAETPAGGPRADLSAVGVPAVRSFFDGDAPEHAAPPEPVCAQEVPDAGPDEADAAPYAYDAGHYGNADVFDAEYADDAAGDAADHGLVGGGNAVSFAGMPVSDASSPPAGPTPSPARPGRSRLAIPDVPFNYTTAIIGAFAVIVTGITLYVVTTASRGVQTARADAPRAAVTPEVLDVRPDPAPAAKVTDDDARAAVASAGETMTLETLGRPIAVPTGVKRVVGHQYLVLLSFPNEADAKELVKFLAQNGVPATAERALTDYAKSWTSVVTARGFDHTKNNPAYDAYAATLSDLLQKYAGDSKFRKTFKIDKYTWRTNR